MLVISAAHRSAQSGQSVQIDYAVGYGLGTAVIEGKRVQAVVPARGGSKGLPLKNLRKLHGVPLVGMAGDCASQVTEIDRAVVSTDHEEIAAVARDHKLDVPFIRPEEISEIGSAIWTS